MEFGITFVVTAFLGQNVMIGKTSSKLGRAGRIVVGVACARNDAPRGTTARRPRVSGLAAIAEDA